MAPFQFLEIQFPFGATSIPCQSTPGRLNIHTINSVSQAEAKATYYVTMWLLNVPVGCWT